MQEDQEKQPVKIKVTKRELTPFETNLSQAREMAIERLSHTISLAEFLTLTNAARQLTPEGLNWTLGLDGAYANRPAGEWLEEFTSGEYLKRFEEEAEIAKFLVDHADLKTPNQKVKIIISRLSGDSLPRYRALAVFPSGSRAPYNLPRSTDSSRDVVFMELNAACNYQASDEVLGDNPVGEFEIDDLSDEQIRHELGFDLSSSVQNFKHRDASGVVIGKRDEKLYLLFALKGGFANEKNRYLISDAPITNEITLETPEAE